MSRLSVLVAFVSLAAFGGVPNESAVIHNPYLEMRPVSPADSARAAQSVARALEAQGRVEGWETAATVELAKSAVRDLGDAASLWRTCNVLALYDALAQSDEASREAVRAAETLEKLRGAVRTDAARIDGALSWNVHQADGKDGKAAVAVLRAQLAERKEVFEQTLDAAAEATRARSGGLGARLSDVLAGCWGKDAKRAVAQLEKLLEGWGARGGSPVLGVGQMSYMKGVTSPLLTLPSGTVVPAYGDSAAGVGTIEDLSAGREVELSTALVQKATELGSPAGAYDFVKSQLRLEWSWGAAKSTTVTLAEGEGNAAELAGVLVGLLRAQGFPARYVYGTIQLPAEKLAGAMGLLSPEEADRLDSPAGLALDASRRTAVLAALTASGTPYKLLGGDLQLGHVWVEAYLPYGSYRGAVVGGEGKQWVPIEPTLTGRAKYATQAPPVDVLAGMGETAQSLFDAWLAQPRGPSFRSFVKARVTAWLATARPGLSYAAALAVTTQRPESLGYIPGTLPYRVVSVQGEGAFLPDALVHQVRLELRDNSGALLSTSVPVHRLLGRRALLGFSPATLEDRSVVATSGGLYQSPPSAVSLVAALKVNGAVVAAASRASSLGTTHQLVMEFALPGGETKRVENTVLAGNPVAVGLASPRNVFVESTFDGDTDGKAERWLYSRAVAYANAWSDAEDEFAALLGERLVRRMPNLVMVSNQLVVEESLGVRTKVRWRGVQIDADLRITTPVGGSATAASEVMRLSGAEGSSLEAETLAEGTGEDSISTTGVLQEAALAGMPVVSIDASNASSQLPRLSASSEVLAEIDAAIALHRAVLTPVAPITVKSWTGTGLLIRNPETNETSYFLSGLVSGGMTIVSPGFWKDQSLVQALSNPGHPEATADLTRIARIVQVPGTEVSRQPVDVTAARLVAVYVLTAKGEPVKGATVEFRQDGVATPRFPPSSVCPLMASDWAALPSTKTAVTDDMGIAMVRVCPEINFSIQGYWEQKPAGAAQRLGLTSVQAETVAEGASVGLRLPFPFALVSEPGALDWIKRYAFDIRIEQGLTGLNNLMVMAQDRFGNPIANVPLGWSQTADGRFIAATPRTAVVPAALNPADPSQQATVTTPTDRDGLAVVSFVAPSMPGPVSVVVESDGVSKTFPLEAVGASFTGRVTLSVANGQGIWQTEMPVPVSMQMWRCARRPDSTCNWSKVRSSETSDYSGYYFATDAVSKAKVDMGYAKAATILAPDTSGDDADTVTLWPRYAVRRGVEHFEFFVGVVMADGTPYEWNASWDVSVSPARVRPIEYFVGSPIHPLLASEIGVAPQAEMAGFEVTNAGQTDLYIQLEQSDAVLKAPDTALAGPDDLPGAYTYTVHGLDVPKYLGEIVKRPGTVTARLFARRRSMGAHQFEAVKFENGWALGASAPSSGDEGVVGSLPLPILPANPSVYVPHSPVAVLTFPARTFRNQRKYDPPGTTPSAEDGPKAGDDEPIATPGRMWLLPSGSGDIRVFREAVATAVGHARVEVVGGGIASVAAVPGEVANLLLQQTPSGELFIDLAPGSALGEDITIAFVPANGEPPPPPQTRRLTTKVRDLGVMPLGHTFVKDVSVADGHLVKQFTDFSIPGRGGGLGFTRTYSSNGSERSPLGMGWSHAYRIFLKGMPPSPSGKVKMVVIGGSGGGQVFDCAAGTICTPQVGYHGSLTHSASDGWVFRTKGGVRYTFAATADTESRHLATAIVDPVGNRTTLQYNATGFPGDVSDVVEEGAGRRLQFAYEKGVASQEARLTQVRLAVDPGNQTDLCLDFGFDAHDNLSAARRSNCDPSSDSREESFFYVSASTEEERSNLESFTDANGQTTHYVWMTDADPLASEAEYVYFSGEAKRERVKQVKEPESVTTDFEYSLKKETATGVGFVFATTVTPGRAEMRQAGEAGKTVYLMDPYGSVAIARRPVGSGVVVESRQHFNEKHLLEWEEDARGRRTQLTYTDGNLTKRVVTTTALGGDATGAGPTAGVVDAEGASVAEVAEEWAYDAFAQWTCHIDAEGRAERRETDSATGLVTEERRLAARVSSLAGCAVATTSNDAVVRTQYLGVNGSLAVSGAVYGDMVRRTDAEGGVTEVTKYDGYGYVAEKSLSGVGVSVTTSSIHDAHGLLKSTTDSLGHHSETKYDALDRPWQAKRVNTKPTESPSPGSEVAYTYYAGGQVRTETNVGTGLVRTYRLDGLNRVVMVTESGERLPGTLMSRTQYDEHGNVVARTDRRGVTSVTEYDFADRPTRTLLTVCPNDTSGYLAQGGALNDVGQPVGTVPSVTKACVGASAAGMVSQATYDAAGNKLTETDALGHTAEHGLDSLYRRVSVMSPWVPSEVLGGSARRWLTRRRFDRTGLLRWEQDGNNNITLSHYDDFGRLASVTDSELRSKTRGYDGNDNLTREETSVLGARQYTRETKYDALGRPFHVEETVAGLSSKYVTDMAYDDTAHSVATRDARGFVVLRKLDDLDRVYEETQDVASANGLLRVLPVDADALLATPLSLAVRYGYDSNGNRTLVVDAEGRRTEEAYDSLNRLLARIRKPMGVTEYFDSYDGEGRLLTSRDARGIRRTATWDKLGRRVASQLYETLTAGGAALEVARTTYVDVPNGEELNARRDADARGKVTTTRIDGLGRVIRVEDPPVRGVTYSAESRYDAKVKRAEKDREGFVTRMEYDGVYRPLVVTDHQSEVAAATHTQKWAYDDAQRVVTQTDRSGITTDAETDGLGRVTKTTRMGGLLVQVVSHGFDAAGHEVTTTDANGHLSRSVFDGAGRLVRATKAVGTAEKMETVSTYDGVGNQVATKSLRNTGAAYDVRSTYDDLNRPVRVEDATGRVTTRAYDEAGSLRCVKEGRGGAPVAHGAAGGMTVAELEAVVCSGSGVTQYAYDEEGKETQLTDVNGAVWAFVYDRARNLVAKVDGNGHLTTYEYDDRSHRTAELQHLEAAAQPVPSRDAVPGYSAPDVGFSSGTLRTQWAYDGNGRVSDETDPKGQLRHIEYGVLGRPKSTTYSGHVTPRTLPSIDSVALTYTENGEVDTVTEAKATASGPVMEVTQHGYDGLERRDSTRRYDGQEVRYGYDVKGNRTKVEDSAGVATGYTYDAADRLKTATTPAGLATYTYWEDGLRKTTSYSDGAGLVTLTESREYDEAGRLRQLKSSGGTGVVAEFDYEYDANGNRATMAETRAGAAAEITTYGYDDANRLVGVKYPEETVVYLLDAVGNRKGEKKALPGMVAALTVAAYAALAPTNALAMTERSFNAVDWMVAKHQVVPAGPTTAIVYDANGNRVTEGVRRYEWDVRDTLTRVSEAGVPVGTYDYDAQLQRVKADTADGHVEYVLDGKYVLQETGARARRYHFGEGDGLAVTDGSGSRWLLNDAQGSTSAEVGTSTTHRKYDAWGNYRGGTAPVAGDVRLGYTGHQYDVESGLTYARARYYDSVNGVFLSRDSVEGNLNDAPSLHRFAYAHANPLRYRDPSGRSGTDTAGEWVSEICSASPGSPGCGNPASMVEDVGGGMMAGAVASVATVAAAEIGAAGAILEATVGPLAEAAVTAGRALLARSGIRAALYASSGALARFADNFIRIADEAGAIPSVTAPVRAAGKQAFGAAEDVVVSAESKLLGEVRVSPNPVVQERQLAQQASDAAQGLPEELKPLGARGGARASILTDTERVAPPLRTREDLLEALENGTEFSADIATGMREGGVGVNVLGDEFFERAYVFKGGKGSVKHVQGFSVEDQIYLRGERSGVAASAVHEGSHVWDYYAGVSRGAVNDEIQAFGRQVEFQRATGVTPLFRSQSALERYVRSVYSTP